MNYFARNSVNIMKMRQFNIFLIKNVYMFKSSNIEGNLCRSASYLISVHAKYCSD